MPSLFEHKTGKRLSKIAQRMNDDDISPPDKLFGKKKGKKGKATKSSKARKPAGTIVTLKNGRKAKVLANGRYRFIKG